MGGVKEQFLADLYHEWDTRDYYDDYYENLQERSQDVAWAIRPIKDYSQDRERMLLIGRIGIITVSGAWIIDLAVTALSGFGLR